MVDVVNEDAPVLAKKARRYNVKDAETSYIATLVLDYQRSLIPITNTGNTRSTRSNTIAETSSTILFQSVVINDGIIKYVTDKFIEHYDDKERAIKLASTMSTRISNILTNPERTGNNPERTGAPFRARPKKAETMEAITARVEKERALERANANDRAMELERERIIEERICLINSTTLTIDSASGLLNEDVILDRYDNDFNTYYDELESKRLLLMNHLNYDNNVVRLYNQVLDLTSKIYTLAVNEHWAWVDPYRERRRLIIERAQEIVFVPQDGVKLTAKEKLDSDSSTFDEKLQAIRILKKNENGYISTQKDNVFKHGLAVLKHVNLYMDHKKLEYDLHNKQTVISNKSQGLKRKITQALIVPDGIDDHNGVLDEGTLTSIREEHDKIKDAIEIIRIATNKIKVLDPSTNRKKPIFLACYSDPDMIESSPQPILIENNEEKKADTMTFKDYMHKIFHSFFGCDYDNENLTHKVSRHKQTNNI